MAQQVHAEPDPIWGGLVPVRTTFGPAAGDSRLKKGTPIPESVRRLMNGRGS